MENKYSKLNDLGIMIIKAVQEGNNLKREDLIQCGYNTAEELDKALEELLQMFEEISFKKYGSTFRDSVLENPEIVNGKH